MSIQFITTPDGNRLAVLPESEYMEMKNALDDAADTTAVQRFQDKLAAGKEELIPSEFANRLIDGDNPIKVWREYRKMKAYELAETIGISQSHMSSLETDQREPSVSLLKKLAEALSVSVDDLI
jgi:DNA-binding XRE family transcriptional regulator